MGAMAVVVVGLLGGCSDDRVLPGVDAGMADADSGRLEIVAPIPPMWTPCPGGFREVVLDGVLSCEPYGVGGVEPCGPGEAHFIGEPGCRTVGDPCPDTRFPDEAMLAPDRAHIYVDRWAEGAGDG